MKMRAEARSPQDRYAINLMVMTSDLLLAASDGEGNSMSAPVENVIGYFVEMRCNFSTETQSAISDEATFESLRLQWQKETSDISSITKIVTCPSYYRIIGMGPKVIPLILRQLEREADDPDHWGWALRSITGENPISEEAAGDSVKIAAAWLAWGHSRYVW